MTGFNIGGSDWLGLGEMVGTANEARAVEGCGKQPSCWGDGPSCSEKKDAFNRCVARQQDLQAMAIQGQQEQAQKNADSKRKTMIFAIIAIVVLVLIIKR